mmetsp:Transcript_43433/g.137347  ORF Transcript_43433/g.137347 Transcript_43433/m.137347 type:complete len:215 (+) Transcript_43433:743-1387(+)
MDQHGFAGAVRAHVYRRRRHRHQHRLRRPRALHPQPPRRLHLRPLHRVRPRHCDWHHRRDGLGARLQRGHLPDDPDRLRRRLRRPPQPLVHGVHLALAARAHARRAARHGHLRLLGHADQLRRGARAGVVPAAVPLQVWLLLPPDHHVRLPLGRALPHAPPRHRWPPLLTRRRARGAAHAVQLEHHPPQGGARRHRGGIGQVPAAFCTLGVRGG